MLLFNILPLLLICIFLNVRNDFNAGLPLLGLAILYLLRFLFFIYASFIILRRILIILLFELVQDLLFHVEFSGLGVHLIPVNLFNQLLKVLSFLITQALILPETSFFGYFRCFLLYLPQIIFLRKFYRFLLIVFTIVVLPLIFVIADIITIFLNIIVFYVL